MKITVMAPALTYALTAVIPHAATDGSIPQITCVALQVTDGRLYVSATDRFTFGVAHLPTVDKSDAEFLAVIEQGDARQLLQIVKLAQAEVGKLIESEIILTVEKEMLVVSTMWKNHSLRLRHSEENVAATLWRSFLPAFVDGAAGDALTSFNPANLAKFVKAMPYKLAKMITYQPNGKKPAFVAVGDSFFGFVMPQRVEYGEIEKVLPQVVGGTRPNTQTEEVEAKAAEVAKEAAEEAAKDAALKAERLKQDQEVADVIRERMGPDSNLVVSVRKPRGVTVTPGAPAKDEDAPDLADKKPATVRPFADSPPLPPIVKKAAAKAAPKTPSEKEFARDKAFYARQDARAAAKKAPAKKAPAKKATPRKVA